MDPVESRIPIPYAFAFSRIGILVVCPRSLHTPSDIPFFIVELSSTGVALQYEGDAYIKGLKGTLAKSIRGKNSPNFYPGLVRVRGSFNFESPMEFLMRTLYKVQTPGKRTANYQQLLTIAYTALCVQ